MDLFTIRHLRFVTAAAEEGSFRRAAATLGVQQSTLSRRVRDIEDAIGAALFLRNHAGVRLTFAGQQFFGPARDALARVVQATEEVARAGLAKAGLLRIGLTFPLREDRLMEIIRRFDEICPDVVLQLVEAQVSVQVRTLHEGRVDVVFLPGAPTIERCQTEALWDEQLFVALPGSDPLAVEQEVSLHDLKGRTFLFMRADPALPLLNDRLLAAFGADVALRIERQAICHEATLMQLVTLRRGATLKIGRSANVAGRVVLRPVTSCTIPVSAVWLRANPNPALGRFLSIARTTSAARAKVGAGAS